MTRTLSVTRWANLLGLAAALLSCAIPVAWAQDADSDPPVRVGRISYASGPVSFSPAGNEEWVEARINRPVVTGDRLWTDDNARAEVSVDNGTWWLGERTSLDVSNMDDRIVQMQVHEGVLEVRVRRLPQGNIVEIDTPNLAFSVTRPGRYRIEVDPQDGSTLVAARDGMAEVYGETASYVVAAGQAYRFYGTDVSDSEFVAMPPLDAFDRFVRERDGRYARATSARYVSPEVIGYEDLDTYGSWSAVASYGNVWFPRSVDTGWAPYRFGHWTWIDPWGWTWVDDEPWGFAPFHYGRWAHFDRGWGWVPGPRQVRPVYAPALVAFVGGAGFSIAVSSGPAIGWFPLGPREVYVPPYRVSRNYFREVNVSNTVVNVTNVTNIYNNPSRATEVNYVNRRAPNAVTAVPPAAFAQAENVSRVAMPVAAAAVQRAPVHAVAAVAPARPALLGTTPVARAKPPAAVAQRQVVAKAPPPPPPIPDSVKLPALEKNPGRPLDRAQVQQLRQAAPPPATPRPTVKVVEQPKPAPRAAPPARAAAPGAPGRAGAAAPSAGVSRPEAAGRAAPALPGAAAPAGPTARPEAGGSGRGQGQPGAPERAPSKVVPPAGAPPAASAPGAPAERGPAARSTIAPPESAGGPAPAPRAPQTPPGQAQRAPATNGPAARALREQEKAAPPGAPPSEGRAPLPAERAGPRPPEARPVPQAPAEARGAPPRAPQAAQPQRPPQAAQPQAAQPQRPVEPPRVEPQRAEPRAAPQRAPEAQKVQPPRPPEARPQPEPRAAPRAQEPRPQPQPPRAPEPRPAPQRPPEARAPQPPPQARPEPPRPPQAQVPQPQPPQARPEPPQGPRGVPPEAPKGRDGKGNEKKDNDKKDNDKKGDNG